MQLAQDIQNYYFDHSAELPIDKRFHFATRMAAWFGEDRAMQLLGELRSAIVPPDQPLQDVFRELIQRQPTGTSNAFERRAPYFAKYPSLNGVHLALFRLRHLHVVYGIDARQELFDTYPEQSLRDLCRGLLNDDEAVRVLSTFAINTIYLSYGTVFRTPDYPRHHFFTVGADGYNTKNTDDIQLLIYLYTHCIIGESNFYAQTIPADVLPVYTAMLERLETIIHNRYDSVNLDNKLEFLVCARICNFTSSLADKIYAECERSLSSEGTFLIDKHNKNIQADRMTFEKSEHRNVLYIMSTAPYTPHQHRV